MRILFSNAFVCATILKKVKIMISWLRKIFIKDYENVKNNKVREAHGKFASVVGIISNLFLFVIKIIAGIISSSISIIADSINNLSDMGSSLVTLVGFKLAGMPADDDHPYGHERIEYVASLVVSIIIVFVGGSLFVSSINKIIDYEYQEMNYLFTYITIAILSVSIIVKTFQSVFNKKIGKIIDSVALEATSSDSRNDCISTGVILLGTIVMLVCQVCGVVIPFSLDGALGIAVSIFIMVSGFLLVKESIDPLIGNSVSKKEVQEALSFVSESKVVLGYHDVVCHRYGPTRIFMTLHAEVDASGDIIQIHDEIDEIEKATLQKFGVELTIHMDPLEVNNAEVDEMKNLVKNIASEIDSKLSIHDFRIVKKVNLSTILFDIVIPYKFKLSNDEVKNIIIEKVNSGKTKYAFIIHVDNEYIKTDKS